MELGEITYKPRYATGFTVYEHGIEIGNKRTALPRTPKRVVCLSSSYIAYIDALGLVDHIVGVSGRQYITNPIARQSADIGYDTNINYEQLVRLRPDIVFIYGIDGANTAMEQKLTELNISYLYIPDFIETTPLGRAEWIVAIGAILDKQQTAEILFNAISTRYESIKHQVAQTHLRVKVMLNAPYRDVWFVPSDNSYIASLIEDGGGEYVCRGTSKKGQSVPISGEKAYVALTKADIWLNPNQFTTMAELIAVNPKFADTGVVKNRQVFNCTRRRTSAGGSDFWESGALRADLVLQDLVYILHPNIEPDGELYYFEQLK